MATHSSILAWKILQTEEPGGATVHGPTESEKTAAEHELGGLVVIVFGEFPSSLIYIPLSLEKACFCSH